MVKNKVTPKPSSNKVEFSVGLLAIWGIGAVLSLMIAGSIMSFGFMTVLIYALISVGLNMFILPQISEMSKGCRTNMHIYAETIIRLLFFMIVRTITYEEVSKLYMYIAGYFMVWSVADVAISFTMC